MKGDSLPHKVCDIIYLMELEALHNVWEKEHVLESDSFFKVEILDRRIKKDFYQRDGIIDLNEYKKVKFKVLFVSNEANIAKYVDELKDDDGCVKTDCRIDYRTYFETGIDDWKGKMRERITALYMFLTKQHGSIHLFANKFAYMDLNKRGGTSLSKDCSHIKNYCLHFKNRIIEEIECINPDIIIWVGVNSFDCGIPELLGAIIDGGKKYIKIKNKKVPILRMWHTSFRYSCGLEPINEFRDIRIGRLCAKLQTEIDRYNIKINEKGV